MTRRGQVRQRPARPGPRAGSHRRRAATAVACAGALACGACEDEVADARPQWTVHVATDAPAPQFGDRLLVELLDADGQSACSGCRRQFGIGRPEHWPISFGVLPPAGGGPVRIRVRLYRALDTGPDGLPGSDRLIDTLGELPSVDGLVRVGLTLPMACFGVEADPDTRQSCDPATGQLGPEPTLPAIADEHSLPQVGSWPHAQPAPCSGDVPPDMRCVPGGAFLLGSPVPTIDESARQPRPERLTVLSPFALDVDEVTVGQVRALVRDRGLPEPIGHNPDPNAWDHECLYLGPDDPSRDHAPINCVDFAQAVAICELLDKRLPTEAEWEYAAGNTTAESTYPWGANEDVCHHAVVARGRQDFSGGGVTTCRVIDGQTVPWGPVPGGHEQDVTKLGLKNLGGNLAEWLADRINPYDSSCWEPEARILFDPICDDGEVVTHVIRGGAWSGFPLLAKAFARNGSLSDGPSPGAGLRCARSL